MKQCLADVAIREVADTALPRLSHPSSCGYLSLVRAAPQQQTNAPHVGLRRMLLIGDEEAFDAARDRMSRIDDFDAEPLQRAVGHVPASHEVEIAAIRGI